MQRYDVVIPFHKKDLPTIGMCAESICRFLSQRSKIFLVGEHPISLDHCIFIPERQFNREIPSKQQIRDRWKSRFPRLSYRCGWLYQQLIKLCAYKVIDLSSTYLVCDSDITFLRDPFEYIDAFAQQIYSISASHRANGLHAPYKTQYQRMMGTEQPCSFSFINHHMFFNTNTLKSLEEHVLGVQSKSLPESILETLDYKEKSAFSEYELYGNWCYGRVNMLEVPIRMKSIRFVPKSEDLAAFASNGVDIVSSQSWSRR